MSLNQEVNVKPFDPAEDSEHFYLNSVTLNVDFLKKSVQNEQTFDSDALSEIFKQVNAINSRISLTNFSPKDNHL